MFLPWSRTLMNEPEHHLPLGVLSRSVTPLTPERQAAKLKPSKALADGLKCVGERLH
jgi:hypothetical protein